MNPSEETREILQHIVTEINAGKVLIPRKDIERGYNIACDRAISIIGNYREGCGLFQLTAGDGAVCAPEENDGTVKRG